MTDQLTATELEIWRSALKIADLLRYRVSLDVKAVSDLSQAEHSVLMQLLTEGNCWIKLSGPYRLAKDQPLSTMDQLGRALVAARPDRLLWGSDWPHLPNGQRDTGELLNLLPRWAPDLADQHRILVDSPAELFFS